MQVNMLHLMVELNGSPITFDNAGVNLISTNVVTTSNQTNAVVTNLDAGDSEDFRSWWSGRFTIDGGSGLDMYHCQFLQL